MFRFFRSDSFITGAAILVCFWILWVVVAVGYLAHPGFFDHVEPMIVDTAQQMLFGRPVYHPLDGPNLYSELYGPLVYEISAGAVALGSDPILAAKIPIAIEGALTWAVLAWVFSRIGGVRVVLATLGFIAFELLWYAEPITFWVRPDELSIFATSLALLALFLSGRILPLVTLAIGIFLAFDAKLDSFIFLFPAFCLLVNRHGVSFGLHLSIVTALLSFLPFLIPGVTLGGFSHWAFSMVGSETVPMQAAKDLFFFVMLIMPVIFFCPREMFWERKKLTEDGIILASAIVSGILIMYPAAKMGSGTHHYAPLSLWVGYLFARALVFRPQVETAAHGNLFWIASIIGLSVWLLLAGAIFIRSVDPIFAFLRSRREALVLADMRRVLGEYPEGQVQMGYGSAETYEDTYMRPWLFKSGIPDLLDAPAAMNAEIMGLPQTPFIRALTREQYRYFILPKGAPFSLTSTYNSHWQLFDHRTQQLFADHYARVESSPYFDVYESRGTMSTPAQAGSK